MIQTGVVTFVTMDRKRVGEVTIKKTRNGYYYIAFDRGFVLSPKERDEMEVVEVDNVGNADLTLEDYNKYLADGRIKVAEQMPPESDEIRSVPPGQTDPVSLEPITHGMKMATFNNEYGHRYYQYDTVKQMMENGQKGATGEPVRKVESYTAKIEGKTRVMFEGKRYDLVVISPGKYHLENDEGRVVKEYDDTTLDTAPLDHVGGGRRKSRRSKKRHASRRAKRRTRRSRS